MGVFHSFCSSPKGGCATDNMETMPMPVGDTMLTNLAGYLAEGLLEDIPSPSPDCPQDKGLNDEELPNDTKSEIEPNEEDPLEDPIPPTQITRNTWISYTWWWVASKPYDCSNDGGETGGDNQITTDWAFGLYQ